MKIWSGSDEALEVFQRQLNEQKHLGFRPAILKFCQKLLYNSATTCKREELE